MQSARDEKWFVTLFESHRTLVIQFVSRRLRDEDDIRDVVAEVFTSAWAQRLQLPHPPKTHLLFLAKQLCDRHLAKNQHNGVEMNLVLDQTDLTLDSLDVQVTDAAEVAAAARKVLDKLSPADAEILKLAAWDGLEPGEIAVVLDIAPTAARVRLHRAKARAEKILVQKFPELSEERIDLARAKPTRKVFNERF